MSYQDESVCKICGKTFAFEKKKGGRKPQFCSEECRTKCRTLRTTLYLKKRYHADPEFRKRRIRSNAASNTKRREEAKDINLRKIAETVSTMDDVEEITNYLTKYMRLKSEVYTTQKNDL